VCDGAHHVLDAFALAIGSESVRDPPLRPGKAAGPLLPDTQ